MPGTRWLVLLVTLATAAGCCLGGAPGRRLLHANYQVGGSAVITTLYDDDGTPGGTVVWGYLSGAPVGGGDSPASLQIDAADALAAVLPGPVTITVTHVDRVLAEHTADRVQLVRPSAQTDRWYLAPGEADRIAAGRPLPAPK